MPRVHLLVIDPQNDFCRTDGALSVPGAAEDMDRLAMLVHRLKGRLSDVHVTLDSHRTVDISHPLWFRDSAGVHPAPFTSISAADLRAGTWTTTMPSAWNRTLAYLEALEAGGRYPHTVWPEHCLIGSEGHAVVPTLFEALQSWSHRFAMVDFVTKGSNPWTEHFSAVQAEVPDPDDPSTQVNLRLVHTLEQADVVLLAGEASSHCLANTVRDIVARFGDPALIRKLHLLTDATSPVPGFESYADDFLRDMRAHGLRTLTTTDAIRDALVPINKKWPIAELLDACRAYPGVNNARRITFEYVMLKGVNDSLDDARRLVRLIDGIPAKINLIPFNPWPGSAYECSDDDTIERFAQVVLKAGYASPVRTPRGRDILAACGQLKSESVKLTSRERRVTEAAE